MRDNHLQIAEIYRSIQGESTYTGLACVFVRLTGCDLRCAYCDSAFAFAGGERVAQDEILRRVDGFGCELVEITGGEPLLQKAVFPLMQRLCDAGRTVLLETSGAHDIARVDPRVVRIVDVKCPSSGESDRNLLSNFDHLGFRDEIKFVVGSRQDFEWATDLLRRHELHRRVHCVLLSPVFMTTAVKGQIKGHPGLDPQLLADWILEEKLPVRLQLQVHKYIWEPTRRGV